MQQRVMDNQDEELGHIEKSVHSTKVRRGLPQKATGAKLLQQSCALHRDLRVRRGLPWVGTGARPCA